jgi:hypothetical protein
LGPGINLKSSGRRLASTGEFVKSGEVLTIRPTKMLAKRLRLEVPAAIPVVTNRLADWCAHEFRLGRYRYLMFCNTASLYPVVMQATAVTNGLKLVARMMGGLQTCLKGDGLEKIFRERIVTEMPEMQWAPIPGPSVLGSMNDLIYMAKCQLADGVDSPERLSLRVAGTPLSIHGMNSPENVFRKLGGLPEARRRRW